MARNPYVGISGFMSRAEVKAAFAAFDRCFRRTRCFMAGVLVSRTTLGGSANKYPRRYPPAEMIEDIFVEHPRALNLVHYATDSTEPMTIGGELALAFLAGGPNCHGVQVNAPAASPIALAYFKRAFPEARVVLQARGSWSPGGPAETLGAYYGLITDVLLDASWGRGVSLDVATSRAVIEDIRAANLGIGVGIAGGLCAETVPEIADLLRDFPDISTDAESGVRDASGGGGNLDLAKVTSLLEAEALAFGKAVP